MIETLIALAVLFAIELTWLHRMIPFGIITAPASLRTPVLAAGRSLWDFSRRWKIVCDSGRWGCQRA